MGGKWYNPYRLLVLGTDTDMPTVTVIEIQAQVPWQARQTASSRWIAICEPMNLSTEANSLDELYSVINETMQLVLTDLLEDNELDSYLRDRGWTALNMPSHVSADVEFNVPWHLVAEGARARGSERYAH